MDKNDKTQKRKNDVARNVRRMRKRKRIETAVQEEYDTDSSGEVSDDQGMVSDDLLSSGDEQGRSGNRGSCNRGSGNNEAAADDVVEEVGLQVHTDQENHPPCDEGEGEGRAESNDSEDEDEEGVENDSCEEEDPIADAGLEISDEDEGGGGDDDPDDDSDESSDDEQEFQHTPRNDLALFYAKNQPTITEVVMEGFLDIARTHWDLSLPKDARTLLNTLIHVDDPEEEYRVSDNMLTKPERYRHFGVRDGLRWLLRGLQLEDVPNETVDVWLYSDGVRKRKSGRFPHEFWILLIRVGNVTGLEYEIAVAGVHYGSKPIPEALMQDFNEEFGKFGNRPLRMKGGGLAKVRLVKVVADAPARQMLKAITSHSAYAACERCEGIGYKLRLGKATGGSSVTGMRFPSRRRPDVQPLRTNERFRRLDYAAHQKPYHSVFVDAFPQLDMIYDFVLDPMHLVYLGFCGHWLEFVTWKTKYCRPPHCIRGDKLHELSDILQSFLPFCPSEFQRTPRKLTDCRLYHANEMRLFWLYLGAALFVGRVDDEEIVNNFLLLHCALRVLSDPVLCRDPDELDLAEECLDECVGRGKKIFGKDYCHYSAHNMLHLVNEVRMQKAPLDDFSAFIAENHFRHMMSKLKANNKHPVRSLYLATKRQMATDKLLYPGGARQRDAGKQNLQELTQKRTLALQNAEGSRYKVLQTKNYTFNCDNVKDSYCEVDVNGTRFPIRLDHFHQIDGEVAQVEGRRLLLDEKPFFDYPYPATEIGIKVQSGVAENAERWPVTYLRNKIFRLPIASPGFVLYPMLHNSSMIHRPR
jgi:hypothetical protein